MPQNQESGWKIGAVETFILQECAQSEKLIRVNLARKPGVNRGIPLEEGVFFFDKEGIELTPRGTIAVEKLG